MKPWFIKPQNKGLIKPAQKNKPQTTVFSCLQMQQKIFDRYVET